MDEPPTQYDPQRAVSELEAAIIKLQHYLRHIRLNKDKATAREYCHQIFKLEADARRVANELRQECN